MLIMPIFIKLMTLKYICDNAGNRGSVAREIILPELHNVGLIHLLVHGYAGTVTRVQSSQEVS
jgi:hypothetical protein